MRRAAALLVGAALAGCVPNPRSEMPDVLAAAVAALPATPDACVEREVERLAVHDPVTRSAIVPPRGFADMDAAQFRGGGGIKGASAAGLRIRHGAGCYQLYGPVIADDRALIRVTITDGSGHGAVWMRRSNGQWRVVERNASDHAP